MGVGRRLLVAAMTDARRVGIERIELDVLAGNVAALNLYRSAGFAVEGIRRRYRKVDGIYEDALAMALLL